MLFRLPHCIFGYVWPEISVHWGGFICVCPKEGEDVVNWRVWLGLSDWKVLGADWSPSIIINIFGGSPLTLLKINFGSLTLGAWKTPLSEGLDSRLHACMHTHLYVHTYIHKLYTYIHTYIFIHILIILWRYYWPCRNILIYLCIKRKIFVLCMQFQHIYVLYWQYSTLCAIILAWWHYCLCHCNHSLQNNV